MQPFCLLGSPPSDGWWSYRADPESTEPPRRVARFAWGHASVEDNALRTSWRPLKGDRFIHRQVDNTAVTGYTVLAAMPHGTISLAVAAAALLYLVTEELLIAAHALPATLLKKIVRVNIAVFCASVPPNVTRRCAA